MESAAACSGASRAFIHISSLQKLAQVEVVGLQFDPIAVVDRPQSTCAKTEVFRFRFPIPRLRAKNREITQTLQIDSDAIGSVEITGVFALFGERS